MPSSSSRSSRRRSDSRKHKKSHKRSRKSKDRDYSPQRSPVSKKTEKTKNEINNDSSINIVESPVVSISSPSIAKVELLPDEEDTKTNTYTEDQPTSDSPISNVQSRKPRKRRWMGDETEKVLLPNMPTIIPTSSMTEQQQKSYILQLQIEELTRRLKMNEFSISPNLENRSPSPEPIYDQQGKRQNTREVRARRKVEEQRHQLIAELLAINPEYKPPADYKPQQMKYTDKVMIPQDDYPNVNFVGLIIGPRGNTLKMLEKETNAKIIIRGKGSVKDGKMGLVKHGPLPGEDEPLHAYITGSSLEIVAKGVEKVKEIISRSVDAPDELNELRKQQLRELALLNGTLRENDGLIKLKLITEAETIVTNTIICTICGGAGHVSSDCKFRKAPDGAYASPNVDGSVVTSGHRVEQEKLDCEYQSLMNELMGKKDANKNNLTLEDRKNLNSGTKINGPTLSITGGPITLTTDNNRAATTIGTVSFNSNGSMNIKNDHNSSSIIPPNSNETLIPPMNSSMPTAPRYSNRDVFDGYHILRGANRNPDYSSYIERDPYRAQHIPALMTNGGNNNNNNFSPVPWPTNPQQQQQNFMNRQWNPFGAGMPYQNSYRPPYFPNNNIGFTPPLPPAPPPPPPPPY